MHKCSSHQLHGYPFDPLFMFSQNSTALDIVPYDGYIMLSTQTVCVVMSICGQLSMREADDAPRNL